MLRDNGVFDVKIISVNGQLSDHYNPGNKTVNLSHDVYHGRNAAAAAVAAHDVVMRCNIKACLSVSGFQVVDGSDRECCRKYHAMDTHGRCHVVE